MVSLEALHAPRTCSLALALALLSSAAPAPALGATDDLFQDGSSGGSFTEVGMAGGAGANPFASTGALLPEAPGLPTEGPGFLRRPGGDAWDPAGPLQILPEEPGLPTEGPGFLRRPGGGDQSSALDVGQLFTGDDGAGGTFQVASAAPSDDGGEGSGKARGYSVWDHIWGDHNEPEDAPPATRDAIEGAKTLPKLLTDPWGYFFGN